MGDLDRGHKYRLNAARSAHSTEIKILPWHTDRLRSVDMMFIIWQKQEQFNSFDVTGL